MKNQRVHVSLIGTDLDPNPAFYLNVVPDPCRLCFPTSELKFPLYVQILSSLFIHICQQHGFSIQSRITTTDPDRDSRVLQSLKAYVDLDPM
jgi:hypothetical protein